MKYDLNGCELKYSAVNIPSENIFLKAVNSIDKNLLLEMVV